MGYTSQVRFMTTTKGFKKITELVKEYYNNALQEEIKSGEIDDTWTSDEDICIKKDGFGVIYRRELSFDYEIFNEDVEGYVMFGWDWVKWLGYNHLERQAYEKAFENCGEFVRCLMVGEDGAHEEHEWNSEKDDGNMPYVSVYTCIDEGSWC